MSLTAADVAEIMRLVEQSSFDELTLELDGLNPAFDAAAMTAAPRRATLGRPSPAIQRPSAAGTQRSETPAADADSNTSSRRCSARSIVPEARRAAVCRGRLRVEEDTIVGIIEVMKLMNTVRAGVRGTVTDILAADGDAGGVRRALPARPGEH